MYSNNFDVIVIGAGSGGLTSAMGLAGAGKKVALIEAGKIGGDCTNVGCVPSKAFIDIASKTPDIGVVEALREVRDRRQHFVDEETPEWLKSYGITFFAGRGSFVDNKTVAIKSKSGETTEITAQKIILSTGSKAMPYSIEGLKDEDILTNENVFEYTNDIQDLMVVGGGYIGCELAESFANLGVNVTIVQRNERLIPREENQASDIIEDIFKDKGIKVLTNHQIVNVQGNNVIIEDNLTKKTKKITFGKILVALGRQASVTGLGLENTKIIHSEKGIEVNKYNITAEKNIFAIGDCVAGNPQFTHWANHEARGVIRNILIPYIKKSVRSAPLPATLYTNIEVARVGKTRAELLDYYSSEDIITKTIYFDKNDRSKVTNDEVGFVKIHFKRVTGKILGATVMGRKAGENLPVLTSAMLNGISAYRLSSQIFAYPTKSEIIKKVADQFVIGTISNFKGEIKYFLKENVLQIATAIIWVTFISIFFSIKSHYGFSNLELAKKMFQFVEGNTFWGPIIYICLYAIRPIVLFPATLMTLMSGALFGVAGGFVFTMIGENLSANFAYLLGRIFGKKLLKPESTGIIGDLRSKLSGDSFVPILMTRLLFFPFDVVNYSAGILKAKWKGFFFGTLVGIIPGALVVIIAGAGIKNVAEFDPSKISIEPSMFAISGILFVTSLGVAKFLKKREVNK